MKERRTVLLVDDQPRILDSVRMNLEIEGFSVLEAQSGGRWRPSAGSVYPTLQQLSDEGLVTSEDLEGRRVSVDAQLVRALGGGYRRSKS